MTLPAEVEILIVGGGPAGLAAAAELAPRHEVLVLEREAAAGGIPRHCGHYPFGLREFRRLWQGPRYAAALVGRAAAAGARIATGVDVTALRPGPAVAVTSDAGPQVIRAKRVLLATGVRETSRAQRLIGGDKGAGALSTGALQGMIYLEGKIPFRRPVILGTELVAQSAVLTCLGHGIRPVAVIEPGPRQSVRFPFSLMLGAGLPYLPPLLRNTTIRAIEGRERVTAVVLDTPGGPRRLDCDGVIVTGRFRPEASLLAASHLARDPRTGGPAIDSAGRLSDPCYYAAGNLLRPVETAGWSWNEGRQAGRAIAADLAGDAPAPARAIRLSGDALAFVVPQAVTAPGAHEVLQLRLNRPAAGRLRLLVDGVETASRRICSRPDRRITLPMPPAGHDIEIRLDEA